MIPGKTLDGFYEVEVPPFGCGASAFSFRDRPFSTSVLEAIPGVDIPASLLESGMNCFRG